MDIIIDTQATSPCPFKDGQLLEITAGGFAGTIVRVSGRYSFWAYESWDRGDRVNGQHHPAGWQIVLEIEHRPRWAPVGEWLYFLRESAAEVERMTRSVS